MIFINIFFIAYCLCADSLRCSCDVTQKVSFQKLFSFFLYFLLLFSLFCGDLFLLKDSNSSAMPLPSSTSLEEHWYNTGKTQS